MAELSEKIIPPIRLGMSGDLLRQGEGGHGVTAFRGLPPFFPFSREDAVLRSDFTLPMAAAAALVPNFFLQREQENPSPLKIPSVDFPESVSYSPTWAFSHLIAHFMQICPSGNPHPSGYMMPICFSMILSFLFFYFEVCFFGGGDHRINRRLAHRAPTHHFSIQKIDAVKRLQFGGGYPINDRFIFFSLFCSDYQGAFISGRYLHFPYLLIYFDFVSLLALMYILSLGLSRIILKNDYESNQDVTRKGGNKSQKLKSGGPIMTNLIDRKSSGYDG
jgi:hypothetical protein